MSVATVITQGFGSFGDVPHVIGFGFGDFVPAPVIPDPIVYFDVPPRARNGQQARATVDPARPRPPDRGAVPRADTPGQRGRRR